MSNEAKKVILHLRESRDPRATEDRSLSPKIRQRGFSLIEIALVLVIAGLALGAGLAALGPQLINKRFSDTQRQLQDASEAIVAFAMVNRRLPCPATLTSNGLESFCTNAGGGVVALKSSRPRRLRVRSVVDALQLPTRIRRMVGSCQQRRWAYQASAHWIALLWILGRDPCAMWCPLRLIRRLTTPVSRCLFLPPQLQLSALEVLLPVIHSRTATEFGMPTTTRPSRPSATFLYATPWAIPIAPEPELDNWPILPFWCFPLVRTSMPFRQL